MKSLARQLSTMIVAVTFDRTARAEDLSGHDQSTIEAAHRVCPVGGGLISTNNQTYRSMIGQHGIQWTSGPCRCNYRRGKAPARSAALSIERKLEFPGLAVIRSGDKTVIVSSGNIYYKILFEEFCHMPNS